MSFLPEKDREYLESKGIAYEEHQQGSQKGVILRGYSLPEGRFDTNAADILILLPPGYPDAPPDMFYTLPWLKLAGRGCYARKADQPFNFNSQRWQRWSRHNREWRPGADGIWTMIKRVENALAIAA
jgi:hypothetical protein